MSYTEFHMGKLIPVKKEEWQTAEGLAKEILIEEYGWKEELLNDGDIRRNFGDASDLYLFIGDTIYEIHDEELSENHAVAFKNSDGSINYKVSYYNGGCGLTEAICEAVEGIKDGKITL